MKIIFFGTSGGVPTRNRNVTAIGVQSSIDKWSLFDCGDGTTLQISKTNWNLSTLDSIFITHLHPDHFIGIFSILFKKDIYRENCELTIYAPKEINKFIDFNLKITKTIFKHFKLKIIEIKKNQDIYHNNMLIKVLPLVHTVPSYAFYIKILNKKIIIAGDNSKPEILKKYLCNLDLLIHETTFKEKDNSKEMQKYMHTTALNLGYIVNLYSVKNLIATHLSILYSTEEDIVDIYNEIRMNYKSTIYIANDFDEFQFSKILKLNK